MAVAANRISLAPPSRRSHRRKRRRRQPKMGWVFTRNIRHGEAERCKKTPPRRKRRPQMSSFELSPAPRPIPRGTAAEQNAARQERSSAPHRHLAPRAARANAAGPRVPPSTSTAAAVTPCRSRRTAATNAAEPSPAVPVWALQGQAPYRSRAGHGSRRHNQARRRSAPSCVEPCHAGRRHALIPSHAVAAGPLRNRRAPPRRDPRRADRAVAWADPGLHGVDPAANHRRSAPPRTGAAARH
jgi:hypothetical protein